MAMLPRNTLGRAAGRCPSGNGGWGGLRTRSQGQVATATSQKTAEISCFDSGQLADYIDPRYNTHGNTVTRVGGERLVGEDQLLGSLARICGL